MWAGGQAGGVRLATDRVHQLLKASPWSRSTWELRLESAWSASATWRKQLACITYTYMYTYLYNI